MPLLYSRCGLPLGVGSEYTDGWTNEHAMLHCNNVVLSQRACLLTALQKHEGRTTPRGGL